MKPIESIDLPLVKWYCNRHTEKWLILCADVLGMALSFTLSTWAFSRGGLVEPRLQAYVALTLVILVVFHSRGHYTKRKPYSNEVRDVLSVLATLALIDAALLFLSKSPYSRATLLVTWATAPLAVLFMRWLTKRTLMSLGGWLRPMVVVGWGDNAVETALAFQDERLMGYDLIAFLIPEGKGKLVNNLRDRNGNGIPSIALSHNPDETIRRLGSPHIVLALEQGGIETYQDMILQLGRNSEDMQLVPSLRGLPLYGMEANHFFTHEVLILTVRNNLARRIPQLVKRAFDLVVSSLVLLLGSPFFLIIAMRVLATGRPVFYGHRRVGQHNKSFLCYKFRTMATNSDALLKELLAHDPAAREEWDRDFKLKNDPRVTKVGHFLRKTSLDELPQLWNVLKGEMSLVGPRPVVTAELERYGNQVGYYFEAKPGITGLWQISGRNDVSYENRVYLDSWYVKNWSLFNDIVILIRTIRVIYKREGAY